MQLYLISPYIFSKLEKYSKLQRNRPGTIKNQTAKYIKTSLEINLAILIKKLKEWQNQSTVWNLFAGKAPVRNMGHQ